MTVQVLGPGCAKCKKLAANVEEAVRTTGLPTQVEKVEDLASILKFGVMATPALVVEGKVTVTGRIATVREIESLLQEARPCP